MRDHLVALVARGVDRVTRGNAAPKDIDAAAISRILVVKPCCFGDVMMATPALRALRRHFQRARIDVLTTAWCAEALRNNPNVDRVYRYPTSVSAVNYLRLQHRVRQENYDIGLSLDRSPLVNGLLSVAGIPERAGIDSNGRGVGLTRRVTPAAHEHETELYLRVVASVGARASGLEPQYCTQADARAKAADLLSELHQPIVVIHPGGAVNPQSTQFTKRWPAERFGTLASELVERNGASIVVVGTETDEDAAQGTVDLTDADVTDLSAQLNIPELAAVCEHAQLYVGNDSGMSHLASAVGTPTVTIFGPTNPEMYRPLGQNAAFCAACSDTRHWSVPRDLRRNVDAADPNIDIGLVSVEEVVRACERLLDQHGANPP